MFDYAVVDTIVDIVVREFSPKMVFLFGSVARHEARDDSDVDIMVVMDTDDGFKTRPLPILRRLTAVDVDVDIFVYTPAEYESKKDDPESFVNRIVRTGRLLYRRP